MPDNPQPAAFALPSHRVLELAGRDAVKFAQAQFMSDVSALAPGQWHWSGWLTPKGRVIALFALLRIDEETLWLVLPDFDPVELASQLQRYVFRSKVSLKARGELRANGAFNSPVLAAGAAFVRNDDGDVELDMP